MLGHVAAAVIRRVVFDVGPAGVRLMVDDGYRGPSNVAFGPIGRIFLPQRTDQRSWYPGNTCYQYLKEVVEWVVTERLNGTSVPIALTKALTLDPELEPE